MVGLASRASTTEASPSGTLVDVIQAATEVDRAVLLEVLGGIDLLGSGMHHVLEAVAFRADGLHGPWMLFNLLQGAALLWVPLQEP